MAKESMSVLSMVDNLDESVTALKCFRSLFEQHRSDQIAAVLRYIDPVVEQMDTVLQGLNEMNKRGKEGDA